MKEPSAESESKNRFQSRIKKQRLFSSLLERGFGNMCISVMLLVSEGTFYIYIYVFKK